MSADAAARKLVLATANPGKAREIEVLLGGAFIVQSLSGWNIASPEETGLTYVENALLKARNASTHTGLAAIADDSGLEVDALGGAPGLYSARYAGEHANDAANREELLRALADIPDTARSARFRCLAVYLAHPADPAPVIAEGCWEGMVSRGPRGTNGFGYDPVFLVPGFQCTAAELDPEIKNRLSHRASAFLKLREALTARLNGHAPACP